MISREELRHLASFECRHPDELAISFYFKPSTPQDKSHREEGILAKDLIRKTIQELQMQWPFSRRSRGSSTHPGACRTFAWKSGAGQSCVCVQR